MSDTPDLESILRRVRKLLAIAEDGRGDPNEAAAAAQQAERIMRKYQIEHADAILAGLQNTQDFAEGTCGAGENPFAPGAHSTAAGRLAVAVAKLHDCQARLTDADRSIQFCGFKMDVQLARYTYMMLVNNMVASANLWKARERAPARARGEFIDGYSREVCRLLREALEEKRREQAGAASFNALVIRKDALVAAHYGDPGYSRGGSGARSAAAAAGAAAGRYADVGRRGVAESGYRAPRIAG